MCIRIYIRSYISASALYSGCENIEGNHSTNITLIDDESASISNRTGIDLDQDTTQDACQVENHGKNSTCNSS